MDLNDYLIAHKEDFIFCQNKAKLKLTRVKRGDQICDTLDAKNEIVWKAQEDGWQVEYFGMKAFFNEEAAQKAKLLERNLKLFACYELQEDVTSNNRVLPKGSYIVYEVDEETNALKNPKDFTKEAFEGRFNKICLVELERISGISRSAPRQRP